MSWDHVEQFFNSTVKVGMYKGIEATMTKETVQTCMLALSVYTEILGGFVSGKLKKEGSSAENYETFLEFMGPEYSQLNYELKKRGTSLHKEVRSKIVHEFQPRPGFAITLDEKITESLGVEYPIPGDAPYSSTRDRSLNYPASRFLIFRVREYYRDFQKGVEKYYSAIMAEKAKEPMERRLFTNFMDAITMRVGER